MLSNCFFIRFFLDSNIITIIEAKRSDLLEMMNLSGIPLTLVFLVLCSFINMFLFNSVPK